MTRPRRNARLSSMRPPASESAIADLEVGWFVQRAAAAAHPVGDPFPEHWQRHLRLAQQPAAERRVAQQRERAFLVDETWCPVEEPAEPLCALASRDALGPGDVEDCRRGRTQLEAAQRIAVRIALPDGVETADREIDRLSREHLASDVDQRAVAQVDRVVQPEQERAQAVL